MIKIKEYPPVISIKLIMEDELLGAKSYPTVKKRLEELQVPIHRFEMVQTQTLFSALIPSEKPIPIVSPRGSEPFKLPRS